MSPTQRGQKGTPGVRRDQTPVRGASAPSTQGRRDRRHSQDRQSAIVARLCCASARGRACEAYLADDKRQEMLVSNNAGAAPFAFLHRANACSYPARAVGCRAGTRHARAFGVVGAVVLEGAAPNSSASVGCSIDLRCIPPYSYYLLADARKSKPRCLGVYPYTRGPLERLMMRAVSLRRTTDDAGSCDCRRDSCCYDHPGFRRADHAKLAG